MIVPAAVRIRSIWQPRCVVAGACGVFLGVYAGSAASVAAPTLQISTRRFPKQVLVVLLCAWPYHTQGKRNAPTRHTGCTPCVCMWLLYSKSREA